MHDAAEAYIGDIVRPLKVRMFCAMDNATLRKINYIEDCILERIAEPFGLPWPMPEVVEIVDLRMLATERARLFDERQPEWEDLRGVEPYAMKGLPCWPWDHIKWRFLKRFAEMGGRTDG
jgi:hypothetical protein